MKYVFGFLRFWRDFIVGDDWRIAAGLAAGLLLTWAIARGGVAAWWTLPIAVLAVLSLAVWRAVREDERAAGPVRRPRAPRDEDPSR